MSSSNCYFLACIQVSQETGQGVWYSHLFQNFPQFIVIHTAKSFGIVNKAEIDVFLELSCFFDDPADVGNLTSGSSAFYKSSLNIMVHVLAWRILSITLLVCGMSAITGRGLDLDYHDIEWFALEMNRDHSVIFEIASNYCILDS